MHILIDARALENRIDGIGQYTLNILNHLPSLESYYFSVIINKNLDICLPTEGKNISYVRTSIKRYHLIREFIFLKQLISKQKPHLYFSTSPYITPLLSCPAYFTLHDLFNVTFPSHFSDLPRWKAICARIFFKCITYLSVRQSAGIITDSKHSLDKILQYYNIAPRNIQAVHLAVHPIYRSNFSTQDVNIFRIKHSLPNKFILHVGNLKPYKNIFGILKAFASYQKTTQDYSLKIIFTSKKGRGYMQAMQLIENLGIASSVEMRDYFRLDEMPLLYRSSLGLFFPSLEEGFGLPVLEAMCCGIPVVTSRGTSTEEVANGHAFIVTPSNLEELKVGINYLANESKDASKLSRAQQYALNQSWESCINQIITFLSKFPEKEGRVCS